MAGNHIEMKSPCTSECTDCSKFPVCPIPGAYEHIAITISIVSGEPFTKVYPIKYVSKHCVILDTTSRNFNLFHLQIPHIIPMNRIGEFNQFRNHFFIMFMPFFKDAFENSQLQNIRNIFDHKFCKARTKYIEKVEQEMQHYKKLYSALTKENVGNTKFLKACHDELLENRALHNSLANR